MCSEREQVTLRSTQLACRSRGGHEQGICTLVGHSMVGLTSTAMSLPPSHREVCCYQRLVAM